MAFRVAIWPLVATFRHGGSHRRSMQRFVAMSQCLSLIPGRFGVYARAAALSMWRDSIAPDVSVGFLTLIAQEDIDILDGVYIGPQCNLGSCRIGSGTLIGSGVHVMSGKCQHAFDDSASPIRDQQGELRKVHIGRDCWLGNGALVMADIGDHAIVAAGAVVTRDVPDRAIVAGNPARLIRERIVDQVDRRNVELDQ